MPFQHQAIQEASGIARSQREPCLFWVHADSGAEPVIYAVDGAGAHLAQARLESPAVDWEDIASFTLDGAPYLLIADTGNNALSRSVVRFLVVAEPAWAKSTTPAYLSIADVLAIEVRYPGQPFDIEGVAVDPGTDEVLVVSKGILSMAPVDPSGPNQALYTASLSKALAEGVVTLEFRAPLFGVRPGPGDDPGQEHNLGVGGGRTTAMDLHPDGREIAILTYREVLAWPRAPGESWAQAVQGMPRAVGVPDPGRDQMEGLSYSHGGDLFLVADERGATNSEVTIVATGGAPS